MRKQMVIKRVKAFAIDYSIILAYIAFLIAATLIVYSIAGWDVRTARPVEGQLIGFFTLTLPVILYFTISENCKHAGTIGKRKLHLQVVAADLTKAGRGQLLIRNCIKFLPWELAHFFVFRLVYFTRHDIPTPGLVLTGLVASQGVALLYLLCLVFNKNNRSLYELLSRTRVIQGETA
jgi:uncharacterized RDD family membrane protein YckC